MCSSGCYEKLNISFDRFIRTTDADHIDASIDIWQRMNDAGDIYLDNYAGWYSVRDESFVSEPDTRVGADGTRVAIDTGAPVTWTEEETYFFRLSAYADKLLAHYEAHSEFIQPDVRRNEVVSFVSGGLRDFSISRTTFDSGCAGARPPRPRHVRLGRRTDQLPHRGRLPWTPTPKLFRRFWPADLHMIGKDIIRFHTVYWPAFLMSAGIELPRKVFAHGFLLNRGEKMSKSVGNVIDPIALVDTFGVDQVRYFLLREVPFGQDGSYSEEAIIGRINADLANELGNLAQRSMSMIAKNLDGIVPQPAESSADDTALLNAADALLERVRGHFDASAMHLALEAIWSVLGAANKYFSAQEPWVLRKSDLPEDRARFRTVLYTTLEVVRIAALLAQPVMPESTGKLLDLLGQPDDQRTFAAIDKRLAPGTPLPAPVGCSRAIRWSDLPCASSRKSPSARRRGTFASAGPTTEVTRVTSCHVRPVRGV